MNVIVLRQHLHLAAVAESVAAATAAMDVVRKDDRSKCKVKLSKREQKFGLQ